MNRALLALAWTLSITPFVLAVVANGALALEAPAWLAPVLLPWLAVAGWPRRRGLRATGSLVLLALALPPLALALALDLATGLPRTPMFAAFALALVLLVLWGQAAETARRGALAQGLYAGLWAAFVPLGAAAGMALDWAVRSSGETTGASALARLLEATPLVAAHGLGGAPHPGEEMSWAALPWATLVLSLLVWVLVRLAARDERTEAG